MYDNKFFGNIDSGSRASAAIIFSVLKDFFKIKSIIDVGCGAGSWLRTVGDIFEMDSAQIVGVDGEYSKSFHKDLLGKFYYTDLAKPLHLPEGQFFDLAMTLEVAEHLPESRAAGFVDDLCKLSSVVLFSAATPGQGGTGHVNEKWPDFWMKEFSRNCFEMFDPIRPVIWQDVRVAPWYAQNIFIFVRNDNNSLIKKLMPWKIEVDDWRLRLIHPGIFKLAACESAGARRVLQAVPGRMVASIKSRMQ